MRTRIGPCIVSLFLAARPFALSAQDLDLPPVEALDTESLIQKAPMSEASWETLKKIKQQAETYHSMGDMAWAVHAAIKSGDLAVVRHQLTLESFYIDMTDHWGETPLRQAIRYGDDITEVLLAMGANVNKGNSRGETPLHLAVKRGNFRIVSLLLDKGADPNAQDVDFFRETPLHLATERKDENIIVALVEAGGDLTVENWLPKTPFDNIVKLGRMKVLRRIFLRAVRRGDVKTVISLFEAGMSPNVKDGSGDSLLHIAVRNGNAEIVGILLKGGAYEDAVNRSGETPLFDAVRNGDERIAALLLKARAYPRAKSVRGESPLSLAKEMGSRDMVRLLWAPGNWRPGLWESVAAFCRSRRPY